MSSSSKTSPLQKSGTSTFLLQLRVIMWKNAILKFRYWSVLLLELVVPVFFMLALVAMRSSIKPKTKETVIASFPSATSKTFQQMYNSPPFDGENLLWRCALDNEENFSPFKKCQPKRIAIAPAYINSTSTKYAKELTKWVTENINIPNLNGSIFIFFESESKFEDYISTQSYSQDPKLPIYSSAIIMNEGYPSWDYTIRLNKTYITNKKFKSNLPRTDTAAIDSNILYSSQIPENDTYKPYVETYAEVGYFTLTDLINSFIATSTCKKSSKCSNNEIVTINTPSVVEFPNPPVKTINFWKDMGSIFVLLIILAMLYPISNVIKDLVAEKETKIREGMMMMSLRSDVLWLSWWLHSLFLFIPLAIILTFLGDSISYGIFISTFFSSSRMASIVGSLIYFIGFFVFSGLSEGKAHTRAELFLACLHPSAAFSFGSMAFVEYEDNLQGVTFYTYKTSHKFPLTFSDALLMMFIDSLYLLFLAWYFANVMPSEFGTSKKWYFLFVPSYWLPSLKYTDIDADSENSTATYTTADYTPSAQAFLLDDENRGRNNNNNVPIEGVEENLRRQHAEKTCVEIKHLKKEFHTATGIKLAVDDLNLTMYNGQITALLGHNGAGKSTAISMLTGLMSADGGSATIEGYDVRTDMQSIRGIIGVCPQHDILFPEMTVEEHLIMFATFKGCPANTIKAEVEKMIQSVGLTEKRKVYTRNLSGGQRRKLSVGIAFIGNSRVVFLDEPTSGMDPYSRRFTWNVIRQHREGRVVVLTTHFMDEADLLGDRIAIMGDGKLRCCGSSLFLKQKFGVGYSLTMEKIDANKFKSKPLMDLLTSTIPDSKLLTDVGTEISFQLPFTSSVKFQSLFETFDSSLDKYGLRSYGVSVTTLEEVFLKVASGTHTITQAVEGKKENKEKKSKTYGALDVEVDVESRKVDANNSSFERIDLKNTFEVFKMQFHAMLLKSQSSLMNNIPNANKYPLLPQDQCHSIQQMSQYLYNSRKDYEASKFGAYSINDIEYGVHSGPVFSNLLADSLIKSYNKTTSIKTRIYPLFNTITEKDSKKAAFATFIVREKETKTKYQQIVSGVSFYAYWLATWYWDNICFQFTTWLIILIMACTPKTELLMSITDGSLGCTICLFIFFGFSVSSFTYLCSFLFKKASDAQVIIMFVVLVLGLGLGLVGSFLRIMSSTKEAFKVLRYFFVLIPPYAFADGLLALVNRNTLNMIELKDSNRVYKPFDWEIAGIDIFFLIITAILYMSLTILVEYLLTIPTFYAALYGTKMPEQKGTGTNNIRDNDVLEEEQRINAGNISTSTSSSTIVLKDIKKLFPGGKFAVKGISLSIPNGECFGLLGINGAGKSTTLSMLTGEIPPTTGQITLKGLDLASNVSTCRRNIGYCPQFDAIFDLLTAREHLTIYAEIKGIRRDDISRVVNHKISEMGLTEYADRSAGTYSGGNKRKLSVAMAMIGEPSIVFLDEPSTGMDPGARRFMWEVISDIVTKREKCSLVLTTHSMEECEALCTRISIMVGGVLRCLGSGQRLRSLYGLGFQVEVGLKLPTSDEIESKLNTMNRLNKDNTTNAQRYNLIEVCLLFTNMSRNHWRERVSMDGTGAELMAAINTSGFVTGKHLASWIILEEAYDTLCNFLYTNFNDYVLRERQTAKIRLEIPSRVTDSAIENGTGTTGSTERKLSLIFGRMEAAKSDVLLRIQDYSVSQTSLEQIFNYFASQQEEEKGHVQGMKTSFMI
eukprot:gene8266-17008_t